MTPRALIVMGVCGTGKTTVGRALAAARGCGFADGDDFHPPANVAKMRTGEPLDDTDRAPWLDRLREHLSTELAAGRDVVLACSALKAAYRRRLTPAAGAVTFVYLHGERALLAQRLKSRNHEYMPASLLDSQFAALEPPGADEAIACDVAASPAAIVARVQARLAGG